MNYIPLAYFDTDTPQAQFNNCFCDTVTITNTSATRNIGANIPWCQFYFSGVPGTVDDNTPYCLGPLSSATLAITRGANVTTYNSCTNTGGNLVVSYNRNYCECDSFNSAPSSLLVCNQKWTFRNCDTGTNYNIAVNDLNTGSFGIGSVYYLNGISNLSGTLPAGCYEVTANVAWNVAAINPGNATIAECAYSMGGGGPLGAVQYDSCFICKRYNP